MKKNKYLSRDQRQIRYIPLFLTVLIAFIYGVVHINSGGPFVQEFLIDSWSYKSISRYIDIPMIYLASVMLVMLSQDGSRAEIFEMIWINIALVIMAGFISWAFSWPFLVLITMVLGLSWGLIYLEVKQITINLLMLFIVLAAVFGFIKSIFICIAAFLLIGTAFLLRLFIHGRVFRRFIFWIGLAQAEDYKESLPAISSRKSEKLIPVIDLSVEPEEVKGFNIRRNTPGADKFEFKKGNYYLYTSSIYQKDGASGVILMKDSIIKNNSFNAVLLDWLIRNPEQIPEEWKEIKIPFWGTIYERGGVDHVRCLAYHDNQFVSEIRWVTRSFDERYHSLVASRSWK
jgi:hypothetical protein